MSQMRDLLTQKDAQVQARDLDLHQLKKEHEAQLSLFSTRIDEAFS